MSLSEFGYCLHTKRCCCSIAFVGLYICIILLFSFKTDCLVNNNHLKVPGLILVGLWAILPPIFFSLEFYGIDKEYINKKYSGISEDKKKEKEKEKEDVKREIRNWQTLAKDFWVGLGAILFLLKDVF